MLPHIFVFREKVGTSAPKTMVWLQKPRTMFLWLWQLKQSKEDKIDATKHAHASPWSQHPGMQKVHVHCCMHWYNYIMSLTLRLQSLSEVPRSYLGCTPHDLSLKILPSTSHLLCSQVPKMVGWSGGGEKEREGVHTWYIRVIRQHFNCSNTESNKVYSVHILHSLN